MNKKEWLKNTVIGPFIRIPRAEVVEILALAGYDFAIIDMEHGPATINEIYPMILASELRGIRLIARVPKIDEAYFKWLLDLRIGGLQIPHVKSDDDAKKIMKLCKFSPSGERGLCRFVRAADFSGISKEEYLKKANEQALLILQIEGIEGVDNIEKITDVPGIDVIFIGPYDLSQSMGLIGQIWHEKVVQKIKQVVSVCTKKGISVGVFTDTPDGVKYWADLGIKYLNYRIEVEMLLNFTKNHLKEIKGQNEKHFTR